MNGGGIAVTKTDLINIVAKEVEGVTKKKATEVVEAIFCNIHEALQKDEKVQIVGFGTFEVQVQIVGFGTFEVQKRAARQGRNPQDPQKVIEIPAKNVPVFRAGKALKEAVNK